MKFIGVNEVPEERLRYQPAIDLSAYQIVVAPYGAVAE
jgi:hypothetical protein